MRSDRFGYWVGLAGVGLAVLALLPLRSYVNSTPIALTFLLVVLFTAVHYGRSPAIVASLASVFCFNLFFLLPYRTLRIADPQNWIALAAFLLTSLIAGRLSLREKRRAEEAETSKLEIERLYAELQAAFAKASEAEAIKQSEKLKSALLDAVTHDLRTPLTSVKAAVTTLLAENGGREPSVNLDEEGRHEMLEIIDAEIDRLNRIVEGLIEMAKIEAGAMESNRTWSHIDEIVSIALARAASITSDHPVRLEIESDLPLAQVDEKALAEVMYVLIENATKYSPPDSEIRVFAGRNASGALQLSIEDRGIGIPADFRERVFEKFFRLAEPSFPTRGAGLGMGLAIARGIVEAHGGRIWVEPSPGGQGTCVSFTIPQQERQSTV